MTVFLQEIGLGLAERGGLGQWDAASPSMFARYRSTANRLSSGQLGRLETVTRIELACDRLSRQY
jgi:hypothetical protein